MATIGHNSAADSELRKLVERIERLNEDKASVQEDIKLVFSEAKAQGYDTKALRRLIQLRAMSPLARAERAEVLRMYADALGTSDIFL